VIFGIGWGLAGICPGPALVATASGTWATAPFVIAMLAGMFGLRVWRACSHRLHARSTIFRPHPSG
jgi:uncharacterized protein